MAWLAIIIVLFWEALACASFAPSVHSHPQILGAWNRLIYSYDTATLTLGNLCERVKKASNESVRGGDSHACNIEPTVNWLRYSNPYHNTAAWNLSQTPSPELCHLYFNREKYTSEFSKYYYGYRYYNPREGRWLSRDPLGEAGGFNLYAFCGNDPVNRLDAVGLAALQGMDDATINLLMGGGPWNTTKAAGIQAGKAALMVFSLGTICKNDHLADLNISGQISDAQFWSGSAMNTAIGLGGLASGGAAANLAARAGGSLMAQGAAGGFASSLTDVVATRCGYASIDIKYEGTIASDAAQVATGTLMGTAFGGAAQLRQSWAGGTGSGILNLTSGDSAGSLATRIPRQPGTFDVVAHGIPSSIGYGAADSEVSISASELSRILARYKAYNAQNLRMLCCCTGQGGNSFGARLARRTWVVVQAPTQKLWVDSARPGWYSIQGGGTVPGNPMGVWRTFSPFNVYFPTA